MAEGVVQLPPDSTGKMIRVLQVTEGINTVYQPVEAIADSAGNLVHEMRFWRLLNQQVPNGYEMRTCLASSTFADIESSGTTTYTAADATSNYFGMATDGTALTATSWDVLRIYLDANGNPVRWRTVTGVAWLTASGTTINGGAIFGGSGVWT